MRYLITNPLHKPFYSNWYNPENWTEGTVIYDNMNVTYTTDGHTWEDVEIDSL
jgi:hypothetical protein